jgi:hypothetical protein
VAGTVSSNPNEWLPPSPSLQSESIATGWKARLLRGTQNRALSVVANALTALRHAQEWQGVLHFNESSLATVANWHRHLKFILISPLLGLMSTMC